MKGKIKSEETKKKLSISKKDKNGKKINVYNTSTGKNFIFNSLAEAAREINISESTIRSSIKRNLKMRNDFICKYI